MKSSSDHGKMKVQKFKVNLMLSFLAKLIEIQREKKHVFTPKKVHICTNT